MFSLYGIFHLLFMLSIFGAIVAAIVLIVQTLLARKKGGSSVEMANVGGKEKHQPLSDE